MHYCTLLVTKEIPTDEDIAKYMEPYNEENIDYNAEIRPAFSWDYYEVGGRYCGMLQLSTSDAFKDIYQWFNVILERNHKLFIASILDELKKYDVLFTECDYWGYFGIRTGAINVDGAKIAHTLNAYEIGGYNCIKPDGSAITREWWNGNEWIVNDNYDNEVKEILNENKDGFLTIIDIHD